MGDAQRQADRKQLDIVREQRQHRLRRAPVRNMGDLDAGDLLEALAEKMVDRSGARRTVIQLPRVRPRIGDEFAKVASGHRRVREEYNGHFGELADRRQCGERIKRHFRQKLVDGKVVRRPDEKRITVSVSPCDFQRTNVAGRSWFRLDDEFLSQCPLHPGSEKADYRIAYAACRRGQDHANAPFRKTRLCVQGLLAKCRQ